MGLPKVDTPKFKLKVPSTGQNVEYRPYLVKEEKILMLALESDDNIDMINAVKQVIESCTEGALNENNITMFDLEYFFTNLRAKSVGEVSEVNIPCPQCGESSTVGVDLSTVKVDVPDDPKYFIRTINDKIKVRMRYPTIAETTALLDERKSDVDLAYDLVLTSMAEIYHGDEVYDANDHTREELVDFIESLDTNQFNDIKNFVEDSPTAQIEYHHRCKSCGYDDTRTLDGLANFFG